MKRTIVRINEELCDGCGLCIPNCHEGALQIIDGKARLISDLMCDGLGACIGHCPQGAITMETREALPYDELKVIEEMVTKGENVVKAHLRHLKDHNEIEFYDQGIGWLLEHRQELGFDLDKLLRGIHQFSEDPTHSCGCPGSKAMSFSPVGLNDDAQASDDPVPSQLTHWPVQLHLINPAASYFRKADVLIAADCTAFTFGDFHRRFLKGKSLVIACPKLDDGLDIYIEKIRKMIDESMINTITVLIMEVPCCSGLLRIVEAARGEASRLVPVKAMTIGIKGEVLKETWV